MLSLLQVRLLELPRLLQRCGAAVDSALPLSEVQTGRRGSDASDDGTLRALWQDVVHRAAEEAQRRVLDLTPAELASFAAALMASAIAEDHAVVAACAEVLEQGALQPALVRANVDDSTWPEQPALFRCMGSLTCKQLAKVAKATAYAGLARAPLVDMMARLALAELRLTTGSASRDGISKLSDAALQFALAGVGFRLHLPGSSCRSREMIWRSRPCRCVACARWLAEQLVPNAHGQTAWPQRPHELAGCTNREVFESIFRTLQGLARHAPDTCTSLRRCAARLASAGCDGAAQQAVQSALVTAALSKAQRARQVRLLLALVEQMKGRSGWTGM